jgi:O-acetyl-ADP-ribose deacetylase (regulator of RNase III)
MAKIIGAKSVSIPAISTGIYSFPKELCASLMIQRIVQWFEYQRIQA